MKIHPIRATLAIGSWGLTGYMLITGIVIPEAWWVIVTAVSVFYFTGTQEA